VITPLVIAVAVCALALLALRSEGAAPLASLGLLEWTGTTTLLGIAFMASILARRTTVWIDWAVMGCLAAVLTVWMFLHVARVAQFSLPGNGAVLPVIAGVILAVNARSLAALPHPFIVR